MTEQTKKKNTPKKIAAKSKSGGGKGRKGSIQSKSGKGDRGKVVHVNKDDSDDDSLDFENEGVAEQIKNVQKLNKYSKPLVILVSHGFVNVRTAETIYVVSFPKLGKVFYQKAEHMKSLLMVALSQRKVLNPSEDGEWMDTIDYYKMRERKNMGMKANGSGQ